MTLQISKDIFADVHCVFLCGGSGTRLWPLSRKLFPKQFLSLGGATSSLLLDSLLRVEAIVPKTNRWLVTAKGQHEVAEKQTSEQVGHMLVEPTARNTAPAIAWAAWELLKINPRSTMVVLSSDHVIKNVHAFEVTLAKAVKLARDHKKFVTIGIQPTFASTGFGYIERGADVADLGFQVTSFREKPDAQTAEQFLLSGKYLWNAGMFVWNVQEFWNELKFLQPALTSFFETSTADKIATDYAQLPNTSIDVAFMEKTTRAACVPSLFDWDDIGSWAAVRQCFVTDAASQNSLSGDVHTIDTNNSLVMAEKGIFVATVGVTGLCVVATHDAVLVMPLDRAQDIKQIVAHLEKNKRTDIL